MENDDKFECKVVMLSISTKCFAVVEKLNCQDQDQKHFIFSWALDDIEQNEGLCITEQVQITATEVP